MTGPEHWREADQILTDNPCEYGCQHEMRQLARAQVHATLALAAVIACAGLSEMPARDADAWQDLTGTQAASVAEGHT